MDNQSGNKKKTKNNPILSKIADNSRRLKILEDRYLTIRKKTQLTDQNMLEASRKFNTEIKALNTEIEKLKLKLVDLTEKTDQMISEIKNFAKREELITLNNYIDFWQPMNFITKKELDDILISLNYKK